MTKVRRVAMTLVAVLLLLHLSSCGDDQSDTICAYHLARANGAVAQGNSAAANVMLWIPAEDSDDTTRHRDTGTAEFYWAASVAFAEYAREHFEIARSECNYWNDAWTDETERLFDGLEELCERFKREFEWPCQ